MKTMNSKRIAVVLTLAAIFAAGGTLRAQSAITIAGGDFKNPSGSVSYSCGEVAVKVAEQKAFTVVNITESFNEGVQQPFTPRDAGNNSISPLTVKLEVYPNPATDCVNIEGEGAGQLNYTLYTMNGQQLQNGKFDGVKERIDLSNYASGNYLLRIASQDNTQVNTYKIVLAR